MTNYQEYRYSKKELWKYGAIGYFLGFCFFFLFYQSIYFSALAGIGSSIVYLRIKKKYLLQDQKWKLTVEFKDAMEACIGALSAGYSMENAIKESTKDLSYLYREDSLIMQEMNYMVNRLQLSYSAVNLMREWGERSQVEDIIVFAEVYSTAQKCGGNLVKVMSQTSKNIRDKIEIKEEIQTLITGKKLESKCMLVIPILIIVYLSIFAKGFLDPLYHNLFGNIVMTGVILLYGVGFWWSNKIMDIQF